MIKTIEYDRNKTDWTNGTYCDTDHFTVAIMELIIIQLTSSKILCRLCQENFDYYEEGEQ